MTISTSALQQKNAKHLIQSFSDLSYINKPEETHIISEQMEFISMTMMVRRF